MTNGKFEGKRRGEMEDGARSKTIMVHSRVEDLNDRGIETKTLVNIPQIIK